jgi:hypothetical protein
MNQVRSETSQLSDISDEEVFYDAEITFTINLAESIRSSKFFNFLIILIILIIFPDLSAKTKDKNLDLII